MSDLIWHPFTSLTKTETMEVASAKGAYLYLEDGRKLIDGISSWWVNLHGHAEPTIVAAIAEQAAKLEQVIFAGFTHAPANNIARNLIDLTQGYNFKKIFFSDDGSTSVEVAIKMAIQYWHNKGINRTKIIALEGAYHGDTFGAMSIGASGVFFKAFAPYLFEVISLPFPEKGKEQTTIDALESTLAKHKDVAAFIYEPLIQGSAGMRIYNSETLSTLLSIAKKNEVVCIADEVLTGFGRTGRYFASDYCNEKPDLMCLSKGITGGFLPLGVTLANERIIEAFMHPSSEKTFYHGHSYTANPIACAAANASYALLTSAHCQEQIKTLTAAQSAFALSLANHPALVRAESLGTFLALEMKVDTSNGYFSSIRDTMYDYFMDKNILLRPLGNVLYFLPPYCISDSDREIVYTAIRDWLSEYQNTL